jgi:hypothetical protein
MSNRHFYVEPIYFPFQRLLYFYDVFPIVLTARNFYFLWVEIESTYFGATLTDALSAKWTHPFNSFAKYRLDGCFHLKNKSCGSLRWKGITLVWTNSEQMSRVTINECMIGLKFEDF